jgi:hypothetical protein
MASASQLIEWEPYYPSDIPGFVSARGVGIIPSADGSDMPVIVGFLDRQGGNDTDRVFAVFKMFQDSQGDTRLFDYDILDSGTQYDDDGYGIDSFEHGNSRYYITSGFWDNPWPPDWYGGVSKLAVLYRERSDGTLEREDVWIRDPQDIYKDFNGWRTCYIPNVIRYFPDHGYNGPGCVLSGWGHRDSSATEFYHVGSIDLLGIDMELSGAEFQQIDYLDESRDDDYQIHWERLGLEPSSGVIGTAGLCKNKSTEFVGQRVGVLHDPSDGNPALQIEELRLGEDSLVHGTLDGPLVGFDSGCFATCATSLAPDGGYTPIIWTWDSSSQSIDRFGFAEFTSFSDPSGSTYSDVAPEGVRIVPAGSGSYTAYVNSISKREEPGADPMGVLVTRFAIQLSESGVSIGDAEFVEWLPFGFSGQLGYGPFFSFHYTGASVACPYAGIGVVGSRWGLQSNGGILVYGITESDAPTDAGTSAAPVIAASPNPSRDFVSFNLELPLNQPGRLRIYDICGRTVHEGGLPSGARDFVWDGIGTDGKRVPAGLYQAVITSPGHPLGSTTSFVII